MDVECSKLQLPDRLPGSLISRVPDTVPFRLRKLSRVLYTVGFVSLQACVICLKKGEWHRYSGDGSKCDANEKHITLSKIKKHLTA